MNEMNVKPKRCTADKPMGRVDKDSPPAMAAVLFFLSLRLYAAILRSTLNEKQERSEREMAISDLLNRRVRAQPEEDEEEAYSEASGSGSASEEAREDEVSDQDSEQNEDDNEGSDDMMDDDPEEEGEEEEDDDDDNDQDTFQESLNNISFGALAKAQSSLGPKKPKRTTNHDNTNNAQDENQLQASPLDDIRARIREAREQKRQASSIATPTSTSTSASKSKRDVEKRSSKHAPMVQSSKHAVSRKRTIIEPPAVSKSRDPRFDPTVVGKNSRMPAASSDKAYSFLNDYRAAELKDLKEKLAKTKDPDQKEELKRAVRSTTDRLRESEKRKREQKILAEHKKREKQMIREGKKSTPYYMKKSDLKKEVLLSKYGEMNARDRSKALERRRKKTASKERLQMPSQRRGVDQGPPPSSDGGRKRKRVA